MATMANQTAAHASGLRGCTMAANLAHSSNSSSSKKTNICMAPLFSSTLHSRRLKSTAHAKPRRTTSTTLRSALEAPKAPKEQQVKKPKPKAKAPEPEKAAENPVEAVKQTVEENVTKVPEVVKQTVDAVKENVTKVPELVKETVDAMKENVTKEPEVVKETVDAVKEDVTKTPEVVKETVSEEKVPEEEASKTPVLKRQLTRTRSFHHPRGGNIKADPLRVIMFQGFNWESWRNPCWYDVIATQAEELAAAGITDVWFPPSSHSVSAQGYMPGRLYDLNDSKYGNEEKLRETIDSYHRVGVRCIADIVVNHRCGEEQDERGEWVIFEGGTPDDALDWGPWAIVGDDWPYGNGTGAPDTGDDFEAAPDIDHTNDIVQKDLINWMNWMKYKIGFDGWRFDFAKGYGGYFVGRYIKKTEPQFSVGEFWTSMSYNNEGLDYNQDPHRQQLVDWVNATRQRSTAFDFTTKGILQEAVRGQLWRLRDPNNKPPGMIGWWPEKAVTFLDNHDTGSTQAHWPFPGEHIMQGYAYILTHPGNPCIFYDHWFDWGLKGEIGVLLTVRKRNDIHATSNIDILTAENDLYVAKIDDRVVVKIGPRFDMGHLAPNAEEYEICAVGKDYCVWEKK